MTHGGDVSCICIGDCDDSSYAFGSGDGLPLRMIMAGRKGDHEGAHRKHVKMIIAGSGGTKIGEKVVIDEEGLDLEDIQDALKGRGKVVMTRVNEDDLETIDLLVESGLFSSRSECAAFLIQQGIGSRHDLLEKVKSTAEKIKDLKEKMKAEVAPKSEGED